MNLNHSAYGVAMSVITSQAIDSTTQARNPGFYPLAIGYWRCGKRSQELESRIEEI